MGKVHLSVSVPLKVCRQANSMALSSTARPIGALQVANFFVFRLDNEAEA